MSDFVSEFWNFYVVIIVLGSIIACAVLLYSQSKANVTQGKTMGHVWDEDLEEYNNALPKWWSWLFYITIVFALGYLVLFPGLGSYPGVLKWTSVGQHAQEVSKADEASKPLFDKYLAMDIPAVAADKQAMEMGKRLYMTYCVQCHGADAKGSKGFPNLADNDWLYGGDPAKIKESILNGRQGMMPPHAHLGADTIKDLAHYVRSLSGIGNDGIRITKGKAAFTSAGCIGCHGPDAKGNPALGAPNLTDDVWLYSRTEATVIETITQGRQNRMPAWKDFLGEGKVHVLAAYVYGLSQAPQK
ncbi:MAG TPA: cytochrome-c oxidase, cbb3-type subunit III [Rhodocyclaceae bacterium]|nr:cytochrome-c oxidase, cbb3-type subunit III [Rhodocyclaceae bacterium]